MLAGVAAGWLPWFWFAWHDHRTEFFFYAVEFEPVPDHRDHAVPGADHRARPGHASRRRAGAAVVGAYLLAVVADFAYMYPLFAAKIIPYTSWLASMWYHGWI